MYFVILQNNELLNCYIARTHYTYNYWATDIFVHFNITVNDIKVVGNHFIGCECRNNGNSKYDAYIGCYAENVSEEKNICSGSVSRIFQ